MTSLWSAYAAAFVLGAAHAVEVDHMVAVSTFIGGRPRLRAALGFGVRWGLGHAITVLLVGGFLAWSGLAPPPAWEAWTELAVGLGLVALGLWALRAAGRLHAHEPHTHGGHSHLHAHAPTLHPHSHGSDGGSHRHRHLVTVIGSVHGLAGSAPVVALIPVSLIPDVRLAVGYLVVFGVGTVLAMGVYSVIAALAATRASSSVTAARITARVTAVGSVIVGVWWVVRAIGAFTR